MNKTCRTCRKTFEATQRQIAKADFQCNDCFRKYKRDWRGRRKAEGNPVPTFRMPRDYQRAYESKYRKRPEVKTRLNGRARDRRQNPIERPKHLARWKLNHAIESGPIRRKPCEICGDKAHGHHDDYSKPLDVRWLCPVHHTAHHASVEGKQ